MIDFLKTRIATSKEIQLNCGLSARQVLLRLGKLGNRIVKIENGRSPKYALTTNAFGVGDSILIWEVDSFGKHACIAELRPLAVGGYFVESRIGMPKVFLGDAGNGLYSDLPYFLRDMAPQGFLGKKIAENLAIRDNRFPSSLKDWNNNHIGRYLLANNETSMGNLKFGNNASLNIRSYFPTHSRKQYAMIADNIIGNDAVLSSAGGEQQKFTTYCDEIKAHVLVKFSPMGNNENAQRWKDILITEYYASQIINESNFVSAAKTELIDDSGRLFLESKRFDRSQKSGRRSMLSLSMIDAEFVGLAESWVNSAESLNKKKLLSDQDFFNIRFLESFAKLIYNTDTHLGNMSFKTHHDGFALLPIYDMCSMGFAPKSNGEVTPFKINEIDADEMMNEAIELALEFWDRISKDSRISSDFSNFINKHCLTRFKSI